MSPRVHVLERAQRLDGDLDDVFAFFADARNLERITPPWLRFRVTTRGDIPMAAGTFLQYALRLRGVPVRWDTLIQAWDPPHRFVDVQVRGPYRLWEHTHTFEPLEGGGVLMRDVVRYALPLGPLGTLAHAVLVRRDVARIFDHRRGAVPALVAGAGGAASPPAVG
jgi:ligand-binding SRPBCC domain-containing protein